MLKVMLAVLEQVPMIAVNAVSSYTKDAQTRCVPTNVVALGIFSKR